MVKYKRFQLHAKIIGLLEEKSPQGFLCYLNPKLS